MDGTEARPTGLRPRAVAREALAHFRARTAALFLAGFVVFAAPGLLEATLFDPDLVEVDDEALARVLAGAVAVTATALLGEVFYSAVVVAVVDERRTGRRITFGELVRTLPLARLIAVDLLFTALIALGLVLLIVPGVVLFVVYAFAAPLAEIEKLGVRAAFRRSRALVRGNFRAVALLLLPVAFVGSTTSEALQWVAHEVFGEGILLEWFVLTLSEVVTALPFALVLVVTAHHLIARVNAAGERNPAPVAGASASP